MKTHFCFLVFSFFLSAGCFKSGAFKLTALTFPREQNVPFHCAIRREGRVCRDPADAKTSSPCPWRRLPGGGKRSFFVLLRERGSRTIKVSCAPDEGEEKRSRLGTQGNPAPHAACLSWRPLRLFIPLQKFICHLKNTVEEISAGREASKYRSQKLRHIQRKWNHPTQTCRFLT